MKINSINNMSSRVKRSEELQTKHNATPNFKGGMALVNFWQMIDNGGKGLQFTVEDMCGTNIERTAFAIINDIKTYNRRKKSYEERRKQGQLKPGEQAPTLLTIKSFPSTMQEGVREFLTGPVMTFAPISFLMGSKKLMGKSANIKIENIINLSDLMDSTIKNKGNKEISDAFVENVVVDLLNNSLSDSDAKASKEQIDSLINSLKEYIAKANAQKPNKKEIGVALDNLQSTFEKIIKTNTKEYKGSTFLKAKYSLPNKNVGQTNFKQYADYVASYLQDITKEMKEVSLDALEAFKNKKLGHRVFTNLLMFFGTAVLMSKIPEIYTKLSGSINPNGVDVYEQAKEINNAGGAN